YLNVLFTGALGGFAGMLDELDTPVPRCESTSENQLNSTADFCFPTSRARGAPTQGRPFLSPRFPRPHPAPLFKQSIANRRKTERQRDFGSLTSPNFAEAVVMRPAATRTRHRLGFTLIEILLVVVILGILGALVYPHFANARADAADKAARTQL